MKLHSSLLELQVLKTITNSRSQKSAAKLFAQLTDECFFTKTGRESYMRVMSLLRQRGELIDWNELSADPILSETVRTKLQAFKKRGLDIEQIDKSVTLLHKYRRMRAHLETSQIIVQELSRDKVDVDDLENKIAEKMLTAKRGENSASWFVHIGGNDKSSIRMIKDALNPNKKLYIPTGLKSFDNMNGGFYRGAQVILASNSGGGKTLIGAQIAENMASWGAKVCVVSIEMTNLEMGQRHLARIQRKADMGKIIDPSKLTKKERDKLLEDHIEFHQSIKRKSALLSFFSPEEDMTIEEILFTLRPFGYDVVMIDYVGLLKGVDGDDQWRAMQKVTRFGKIWARINDTVLIQLAQLTDEGNLASSRGMKRDANNMWTWKIGPKEKETGIVPIEQPKARNQKDDTFLVKFDWPQMSVGDLSDDDKEEIKERKAARKNKGNAKAEEAKEKQIKDKKAKRKVSEEYFDLEE